MAKKLQLGKKYRDTIHGFEGVATCQQIHLTGCDRVYLEIMKDGEIKGSWFDITQLEGVMVSKKDKKPGGCLGTTSTKS